MIRVRVDLRDVQVESLSHIIKELPEDTGLLLTSWQWSAWHSATSNTVDSSRVLLMVPDFLYYARLASTGQAKEIIKLPNSLLRLTKTALVCVPTGMRSLPGLAQGNFWAAAEALLTYDMGLIERDFDGEVILHYNLSDFMWLFNRDGFLERFVSKAKGRIWGVATQQLEMGLSACARWNKAPDRIMYTTSFHRKEEAIIEISSGRSFPKTKWTIDVTQWPDDLVLNLINEKTKGKEEWLLTPKAAQLLLIPTLLIS